MKFDKSGELPSPLVYPLTDNQRLVELVAEVTGKSTDSIRRILCQEELCLGDYHRNEFHCKGIEPHVWSSDLEQYYKESDSAIMGHASWNRRQEKLQIRQWMGKYLARLDQGCLDILTIGDGAGYDSLYLALCGHHVTYTELSRISINFATRIFADSNVDVQVIEEPSQIAEDAYDVVVCLDVLEHIPEPEKAVAQFARYLRPGGRFIVHAPFFYVTWCNPTHLRSNRKYSGDLSRLYTKNGLRLEGGRLFWDPLVLVKCRPDARLPSRRPMWNACLRCAGLLLAIARYWNHLHNWIAARLQQKGDSRWLRGLAPDVPSEDGE